MLPVPWATEPSHSHLVTRDELRALLAAAGFRIDVDEDPWPELFTALQQTGAAPTSEHGLNPALFIDDVQTKVARYMHNMTEGRTASALMSCTAV